MSEVDSEGGTPPLPGDADGEPAGLTRKQKKNRRSRQRKKEKEREQKKAKAAVSPPRSRPGSGVADLTALSKANLADLRKRLTGGGGKGDA